VNVGQRLASLGVNQADVHDADVHDAGVHDAAVPSLRVDATAAAHAAGLLLDGALGLADATAPLLSDLDIDPRSLGTLADAGPFLIAHQLCVDDVADLLENLRESLEGDADRLYQVAFAADEADRAAAARMGGAGRRMGSAGRDPGGS
jgi:hypothetical protein